MDVMDILYLTLTSAKIWRIGIINNYMSTYLYNCLVTYGLQIELSTKINGWEVMKWTEEKFDYVRYNPRKDINRYGLSITSLDGGLTGVPDLDSLHEYNLENKTKHEERDFRVKTPVYEHKEIRKCLEPFDPHIFRTHILKINPGGYFPKHRDFRKDQFDSARLIVPLHNPCHFILDEKILHWEIGRLYFVDTAKPHVLFNCGNNPSYWLVVNIDLNQESFDTIAKMFRVK